MIPRATYRLQFNEHFRLADALSLVPYLHELGISHVYASPLFKAAPYSVHGYDVCDFGRLNPEIGTESDLQQLVAALRERKMGLVLDIVPNHMGIATPDNAWWQDVLKNGRASRFAEYFDIQWDGTDPELQNKILLPVLGDPYDRVLERGELRVEINDGQPWLRYFENRLPIAPNSMPQNYSLEQLNSNPAELDQLIQKQHYRLAFWREGDLKLNYRRFFAVSTLAAIRVENETVFNAVHALLKQWLRKNWLDGLRVDHPDGLRDPRKYTNRLRSLAPAQWIVVEKILQPGENVPGDWPVAGTVGYDFLNQVNGLFIQGANRDAFVKFYSEFTGEPVDARKMVREKKRIVLETLFVTEMNRLMDLLGRIPARRSLRRNGSAPQLRDALTEFAACFPVYRTFVRPGDGFVRECDLKCITNAVETAKKSRPDLPPELFDFLGNTAALLKRDDPENDFAVRFQQLTGPAMAKGVEDTTFYCLNHFASLNEVGGDLGKFAVSDREFHEFCSKHQEHGGASMLCTSTHDTKRSEDVRARLNVLSEIPRKWKAAVLRWSEINQRRRKGHFPDRNMEYLFYQILAGAWPLSRDRILAYMEKASCEAKQHTDWNNRNAEYDEALKNFIAGTLADESFVRDLEQFIASVTEAAQINSLAQTLIKLTAPGVPDIYQGNEIWDFSLVDPDNRRPVDFELRKRLLAETKYLSAESAWKRRAEGVPKLWLIQKTLAFRARHQDLFQGTYEPLLARGKNAERVIAFARSDGAITVVPRFAHNQENEMPALLLPRGMWRNEFTHEMFLGEVGVARLFRKFPVALLARE